MLDPNAMAAMPVLDTSMSQIDTWSRCDRKYFYRNVRGLVPVAANTNMQWGTLYHAVMQEYYRNMKNNATQATALHNAHWIIDNADVIKNAHHGDTILTLDKPVRENMHDVLDYYYMQVLHTEEWDSIEKVEDSIYLIIGYNGRPVLRIRSTLDLLARKDGHLVIVDHKTTGDVEKNLDFLKLDFQGREYPLAVKVYYEEDPRFCYNMISRDVPPGFGKRPLTTETGKTRNAETLANMQRPERYLRREWLQYTDPQYKALQMELVRIALMLQMQGASGIWPRRIVKIGGMACDRCEYFELCAGELDGRTFNDDSPLLSIAYTRDPKLFNPPPQILVPAGLPGNPFS